MGSRSKYLLPFMCFKEVLFMATIYLYHGTTYENYQEMVTGNEFPMRQNWKCADPKKIYLYGTTNSESIAAMINRAKDSAIMAAAILDAKVNRVVVIGTWIDLPGSCALLDGELRRTIEELKDKRDRGITDITATSDHVVGLMYDNSDDFCEYDNTRFTLPLNNFLKRVRVNDRIITKFYRYFPEDRWKYMYNIYHSCAGMSYDLCKDFVVNREEMEKKCDKWYEEHNEYEWWFREDLDKCTLIKTMEGC